MGPRVYAANIIRCLDGCNEEVGSPSYSKEDTPGGGSHSPNRLLPPPTSSGTLPPMAAAIVERARRTVVATTKKNLIDRIAESTDEQPSLAKRVVQQFFDEIVTELARGNRLGFRDFGVFETKITPARTAQNPRTLQKVQVPAKRRVVFRAGRAARKQLNIRGPD